MEVTSDKSKANEARDSLATTMTDTAESAEKCPVVELLKALELTNDTEQEKPSQQQAEPAHSTTELAASSISSSSEALLSYQAAHNHRMESLTSILMMQQLMMGHRFGPALPFRQSQAMSSPNTPFQPAAYSLTRSQCLLMASRNGNENILPSPNPFSSKGSQQQTVTSTLETPPLDVNSCSSKSNEHTGNREICKLLCQRLKKSCHKKHKFSKYCKHRAPSLMAHSPMNLLQLRSILQPSQQSRALALANFRGFQPTTVPYFLPDRRSAIVPYVPNPIWSSMQAVQITEPLQVDEADLTMMTAFRAREHRPVRGREICSCGLFMTACEAMGNYVNSVEEAQNSPTDQNTEK